VQLCVCVRLSDQQSWRNMPLAVFPSVYYLVSQCLLFWVGRQLELTKVSQKYLGVQMDEIAEWVDCHLRLGQPLLIKYLMTRIGDY